MDAIKLAIKCNECLNILNKPVMLPCGLSVCQKHIENFKNRVFFCKECEKDHLIEESNLIVNKGLEMLIEANLDNLKSGPNYDATFKLCEEFDVTIRDAETLSNEPAYFIKQTINKLKNTTELIREEHKLKIDEKADDIIKQLESYELECNINIDTSDAKIKIAKIKENIGKMKQQLANWKKILNSFELKEDQSKTVKTMCDQLNSSLKIESCDLKKDFLVHKLDDHSKTVLNFQEIQLKFDTK